MRLPVKKYLKNRFFVLGTVGVLVAVFGIIMTVYGFPKIVKKHIAKRVSLEEGNEGFEMWKEMPIPLKFKVYIFNVTNPEEVANGSKPIVEEIGPYVYDQHRVRDNIKFLNEDQLSFDMKKIFIFNEEASYPYTQFDAVNVLNVALMGITTKISKMFSSMLGTWNQILPHLFNDPKHPFLRTTVSQFLFDGVFIDCSSDDSMVAFACSSMKNQVPPTIRVSEDVKAPGFYFSMFNHINDTFDGPFVINRGVNYPDLLGNIVSYKNETTLEEWEDDCSQINGTDSTIFAPLDETNVPKKIFLYQPEACRVMYADYTSKKIAFSLHAFRYETTKMVLGSKKTNPDNKCFCPENWSSTMEGCEMDGVQNLEPCHGAPVIASFPHFYLGDPKFLEYVEGLKPNKEKHVTFVDIEPKTGAALRGAKRLQFNMELLRMEKITILESVEPGLFPILWVEESAEINDKIKNMLVSVHNKIKFIKVAQWIILAVGIILMMASFHFKRRGASEKWSWSPNKVEGVSSYGVTVSNNEIERPAAAQKDRKLYCLPNNTFSCTESVSHK